MKTISCVLMFACLFFNSVHATDTVSDETKAKFQSAISHMQNRNFNKAVKLFEDVLKEYESQAVLWNYGISTSEIGDHDKSLKTWRRYLAIAPDDWRVKPKLIQSYQALGKFSQRDQEISKLLINWQSTKDRRFKQANKFCREQFYFNKTKFFVFEYFEPKGDSQVFYEFIATDDAGRPAYRLSLGSYLFTNEIAWQTGDLPRDKQLYHIDRYENNSHKTYTFFEGKPTYDEVRKTIVNIIEGRLKPESSYSK